MKTLVSKSTQIISHIVSTTTNDPRMIEILEYYIRGSYHQGIYYNRVVRFGIDHYEGISDDAKHPCTHLKVYFGPAIYTIMSMKKLKRWGRRFYYFVEDLFQNSYDNVGNRIETIIDQYPNDPPDRERLLRICKRAVQEQHAIDLQRAWRLFQEHATYIHPRTGRETCKMNLFQFTKQIEQ